jgi:tRNA-specific 2-thiouridylase
VDADGAVLGKHDGVHGFTIGQRKGLHLDRPALDGNPRYVLSIEPVSNTVTVGPADALGVRELTAIRPVWTGCEPPSAPIECTVQLRAHGEVHPCTAQASGEELHIYLSGHARGVAAGQAAVLYRGDKVLGSATIAATR